MRITAIILNVLLLIVIAFLTLTQGLSQSDGYMLLFSLVLIVAPVINLLAQRGSATGMKIVAIVFSLLLLFVAVWLALTQGLPHSVSDWLLILLMFTSPAISLLDFGMLPRVNNLLKRALARADNRTKRLAVLAFPFFAIITFYRWVHDFDKYDWPSLSFLLSTMATVLCLLIAFTRLGDWLCGECSGCHKDLNG